MRDLLLSTLAALALAAVDPPAGPDLREAEALLARADLSALAPESFRSLVRLGPAGAPDDHALVEVWRKGEDRSLVRFLDEGERGKYLVRRGDVTWFLAPGSSRAIRLGRGHRLRGSATLDDILSLRTYRDHAVESMRRDGEEVVLELRALDDSARFRHVRYHVDARTERPVRVECSLRSGKLATVLEVQEWTDGPRPTLRKLSITDALRGGDPTTVEFLELEERDVPDGLFDLEDDTARGSLKGSGPGGPGG